MTPEDSRKEITQLIQQLPDDCIQDLLSFLNQFKEIPNCDIVTVRHIKKILNEDKELLKKLAK